jgi:inosine triphosphate pyrophosphatase
MAPKGLNFITGNKNKLAEVQAILSSTPVKLQSQALDLIEIQGTIEQISRDKANRAAEAVRCAPRLSTLRKEVYAVLIPVTQVQGPVLVEDTCLCFDAFDELPGPYVYAYLSTCSDII